jgi:hypothetical protein
MSDSKLKIIPATVKNPQAPDNEVYISNTNESTGLKITHYLPVGGEIFSADSPLTPGTKIQYKFDCPEHSVMSTTNSYWAY